MATYIKIASNTVGAGGVASVTFSSIPSTYTDLVLHTSVRGSAASNNTLLSFNGSGGTAYTDRIVYGTGSAAASQVDSATSAVYAMNNPSTYTASTFASGCFYIPNYASANYKSISYDGAQETNATPAYMYLMAGVWANTAAINSITCLPNSGNYVQYSTFTLYGISNA